MITFLSSFLQNTKTVRVNRKENQNQKEKKRKKKKQGKHQSILDEEISHWMYGIV